MYELIQTAIPHKRCKVMIIKKELKTLLRLCVVLNQAVSMFAHVYAEMEKRSGSRD